MSLKKVVAAGTTSALRMAREYRPVRVTTQTPTGTVPVRRSSFDVALSASGPHILTVALEDYYQVGAFNRLIQRGQWYRFERRIEQATNRTLDLLDQFQARATFFVLGWVADTMPELVRAVADRGHEIASKGYYHRNIRQLTPSEFRDDLARARESLEHAGGHRVLGYRVADRLVPALGPVGARRARRRGLRIRLEHRADPAHLCLGAVAALRPPAPLRRPDAVGAADLHRRRVRVPHSDRGRQLLPATPAQLGAPRGRQLDAHVHRAVRDVLPHLGARSRSAEDSGPLVLARAPVPQPRSDAASSCGTSSSATSSRRPLRTWDCRPPRSASSRGIRFCRAPERRAPWSASPAALRRSPSRRPGWPSRPPPTPRSPPARPWPPYRLAK